MELDRRQFLAMISGAILSMHMEGTSSAPEGPKAGRIKRLRLKTHALAQVRDYYAKTIGFGVLTETPTSVTFAAGATELQFDQVSDGSKPFYHFAFNIPENKLLAAHKWQLERGLLMPIPDRMQASGYPDGVVDFSHWNAHSVFFLDPGGNVVEYIARHDLNNPARGPFSVKDILYASEIAFIVDDVAGFSSGLTKLAGVGQYRGGDDQFRAMGDERGLLLVMKRGRVLNFRPESQAKASKVFPTEAWVTGSSAKEHAVPGFPYLLHTAP